MLAAWMLMAVQAGATTAAPPPPPPGIAECRYSNAGVIVRKRFELDPGIPTAPFDGRKFVTVTGMPVLRYEAAAATGTGRLTIELADFTYASKGTAVPPVNLRFARRDQAAGPPLLFTPAFRAGETTPPVYGGLLLPTPAPAALTSVLEGATGAFRVRVSPRAAMFDEQFLRVTTADMARAAAAGLKRAQTAPDATPRRC